jgi:hypothetical protein
MEVKNIFARSRVIFLAAVPRFKPSLDEEDASHFKSNFPHTAGKQCELDSERRRLWGPCE